MPKDDWAKAKRKERGAQAARDGSALYIKKKAEKKRKSRHRNRKDKKRLTSNSKLWFGKYRGTAICDIPPSYLAWIVEHCQPASTKQMAKLQQYLSAYLNPGIGCGETKEVPASPAAKPFVSLGIPLGEDLPSTTGEMATSQSTLR